MFHSQEQFSDIFDIYVALKQGEKNPIEEQRVQKHCQPS
jgi:hypothetical protein